MTKTATSSKGGRPTKYNERMQEHAEWYIDNNDYPLMSEMAIELGVDQDTLMNWGRAHPQFFGAIKKLRSKAETWLIRNGLEKGKPTMHIFLLKANHGYIETARQELTGKDGAELEGVVVLPPKNGG